MSCVPASSPCPPARPGWVTVMLRASALNWHDVLVRQGRYGSPLPHIIGADGAGVRTDTGENVVVLPSLNWGDRDDAPGHKLGDPGRPHPWHLCRTGQRARRLRGSQARRPELGRGRGAAAGWADDLPGPVRPRTASPGRVDAGDRRRRRDRHHGDRPRSRVRRGDHSDVLVGRNHRSRGVRRRPRWRAAHRTRTGRTTLARCRPDEAGFDLVLDPVGRWNESVRALRPGGRLVVLGANAAQTAAMDIRSFYFGQFDLLGTTMGSSRDFAGLLDMLDRCSVRPPVIDREFPLGPGRRSTRIPGKRTDFRQMRSRAHLGGAP